MKDWTEFDRLTDEYNSKPVPVNYRTPSMIDGLAHIINNPPKFWGDVVVDLPQPQYIEMYKVK